jgi:hypothetical protein
LKAEKPKREAKAVSQIEATTYDVVRAIVTVAPK